MKIIHVFYRGWGNNAPKIFVSEEPIVLEPVYNDWKEEYELEEFIDRPEGLITPYSAYKELNNKYYGVLECGQSYEGYIVFDNDNKITQCLGEAREIYERYPELF